MDYDLTIVDVETTGFQKADRIVEVALVRVSPNGEVVDSFESLVNPERDVGPTGVHGVTSSMVAAAPTFDELASTVADRIAGTVLVAHNLPFDTRMLAYEFERSGASFDQGVGLCTLSAMQCRLDVACSEFGIAHPAAHRALEDALVTAQLFIKIARTKGFARIDSVKPASVSGVLSDLPFRTLVREAVGGSAMVSPLAKVARMANLPRTTTAGIIYAESLDRALLDLSIDETESLELGQLALDLGLGLHDLDRIHRSYFNSILKAVERDGLITDEENRLLSRAAAELGLGDVRIPAPTTVATTIEFRAGLRVCFTGSATDSRGRSIDREQLEAIAARSGMVCVKSVTKKNCDLLVAADPASSSGKAKKARAYNKPILSVEAFVKALS